MAKETAAQQLYQESLMIKKAKVKIANLCHQTIENPEVNIDRVGEILRMLETKETSCISEIRRLVCLSLCEIFCDVLPSYRIRPLTEKEKSQKAKKETKKLQAYEEKLLGYYKKFTTVLAKMIRGQPLHTGKSDQVIATCGADEKVGVKCAGTLLTSNPSFNHSEDLMKMLIPVLNYDDNALSNKVRGTAHAHTRSFIQRLFREDRSGEASLTLVRGIVQFAKAKSYRVQPALINPLLHLNVREVASSQGEQSRRASRAERKAKWSRKQRKEEKKNLKFNQEMNQLQVSQSRESRLKINSKIVAQVFLLYFKVLQLAESIEPPLLSAVLAGLSRHAHLISIEFFDDLFRTFNNLLATKSLSPTDSVACVHTAMTVLTGQGEALEIDPRRFYNHLYCQLLPAVLHGNGASLKQILACLELMLVKRRRQVSVDRTMAFIKRLATCALNTTSSAATSALVAFVHRLLRQEPRAAAVLLDADPDKGQGCYDPDAVEPEFANASAASLWELAGLRRHVGAEVRTRAGQALQALTSITPALRVEEEEDAEEDEEWGALSCVREAERSLGSAEVQRLVARQRDGSKEGRKRKWRPGGGQEEPQWVKEKLRRFGESKELQIK